MIGTSGTAAATFWTAAVERAHPEVVEREHTRAATRNLTIVLPTDARTWLVRQAAARATETGERCSVSRVVRELVAQARDAGPRAA